MIVHDIHRDSLAISTALSEYYVEHFIQPLEVIALLNKAKIRFMLVGAHGIGGWMNAPRTTQDVDVIVAARGVKKAVSLLLTAFSQLDAEDHEVVVRLRDRESQRVAIGIIKPVSPLFRVALKHTHRVEAKGHTYNIPSIEMALAMKFAPMTSPLRVQEKKFQDAHDFISMVKSNPDIDLVKLIDLGQLVYNGGGAEIVEMVRQVRAGERLKI